jgi:hypothetical protein
MGGKMGTEGEKEKPPVVPTQGWIKCGFCRQEKNGRRQRGAVGCHFPESGWGALNSFENLGIIRQQTEKGRAAGGWARVQLEWLGNQKGEGRGFW